MSIKNWLIIGLRNRRQNHSYPLIDIQLGMKLIFFVFKKIDKLKSKKSLHN
jgi:hypothetical protein